jgi:hypothetical protein
MHVSRQPTGILSRFTSIASCLLLWAVASSCLAGNSFKTGEPFNLTSSATVLEDPSKKLTIDDVRKLENAQEFKAWTSANDIHFGFSSSAHWIRIPVKTYDNERTSKILEIPYAQISEIAFYAPNQKAIITGSRYETTTRAYFHRFFAFPVEITGTSQYVYLRVVSDYALTVPIKLWQESDFHQHQQKTLMLQFLYYGGLLTLLIYNLFLFISLRNRQFLYYALFAGLCGLGMLAGNGYGRLLLWPDFAKFDDISQTFLFSLTSAMGAAFTAAFLSTREKSPFTHRLLKISAFIFVAIAGFLLATLWIAVPTKWAYQLFSFNGVFSFYIFFSVLEIGI